MIATIACSPDETASKDSKGIYKPGEYSGNAEGYGGVIDVKVTVNEDKITGLKAEGLSETEGIGSQAVEQLPARIVEKNGTDVEVVSGATYTSKGLIAATEAALSLARMNK